MTTALQHTNPPSAEMSLHVPSRATKAATTKLLGVLLSLTSMSTAAANDFDYLPYVKALAPEVHLHPQERFFPSSVDFYVNRCQLFWNNPDGQEYYRDASMAVLQSKSKWLRDRTDVHLRIIPPSGKKWGEFFVRDTHYGQKDVLEQGKVPCYYHVHAPGEDFVYIIYYFFYPFNGSMGLAHQGVMEAHEGDWEHLTVTLKWNKDKTRLFPVVAAGGGHGGLGSVVNPGCDPRHFNGPGDLKALKVYSALHSHASYAGPGEYKLKKTIEKISELLDKQLPKLPGILESAAKKISGDGVKEQVLRTLELQDLTSDGGIVWKTSKNLVKADDQFWFNDYTGRWGTIKTTDPVLPTDIPLRNQIQKLLRGQVSGRTKGPFGPKGKGQDKRFFNPAGTLWNNSLKDTGHGVTSVHISNDGKSVYAALRGYILRLDPLTGSELGRKDLKDRGDNEVRMDSDKNHLYAGIDGYVYALDPTTLEIKWVKSLPGTGHGITSVHVREDVKSVFAACNGHVLRLWPKTGQEIGRNDLKGTGDHEVRMASDGNSLYVGTHGYAYALTLGELKQQWKSSLKGTGNHVTSVHVNESNVYATCGGQLLRLRSSDGKEQARREFVGRGNHEIRMASDSKFVYVGMNGAFMECYRGSLVVARFHQLDGSGVTSVAVDGGSVYATCKGRLFQFKDGKQLASNELSGTGEHEVRIALRHNVGLFLGTNGHAVRATFPEL